MNSLQFPDVHVGEPIGLEHVQVFPLFSATSSNVAYEIADQAMQQDSLVAEEVSDAGTVPKITVENRGDVMVLLLEGEELIGAKQNRILNTTVLVKAKSKTQIPVSCVEAGRWAYRQLRFLHANRRVHHDLQYQLKASVHRSLVEMCDHASDQAAVWREVAYACDELNVSSETMALAEAYGRYVDLTERLQNELKYVDGARGFAIALNGNIITVDLFDRSDTCRSVWQKAISGITLDVAADARASGTLARREDVEQIWRALTQWTWNPVVTVGEGQEYRAESPEGHQGSALVYNDTLIHLSVVFCVTQDGND